jgi:hypothetical protein
VVFRLIWKIWDAASAASRIPSTPTADTRQQDPPHLSLQSGIIAGRSIAPRIVVGIELRLRRLRPPAGRAGMTLAIAHGERPDKSDPVSLDTVWTTMTAAKEAGHEGQGAEADHDSWQ